QLILSGFERMSEDSRYRRFMGLKRLTERDLAYLTEIDYVDHYALVARNADDETDGVGVARYVRDTKDPASAEAAIAVVDEHHGRGIGTIMLATLGAVALENGIRRFTGYMLSDNKPVIDLVRGLGAEVRLDSQGLDQMVMDLPQQMNELKDTPLYAVLRAVARGEAPDIRGRPSGRDQTPMPDPVHEPRA
ncbi:MAG: GNAT family N-acetyltransferase, partial [Actinomycetota bacterium]